MKKFELVAEVITLANYENVAFSSSCGSDGDDNECHATKI